MRLSGPTSLTGNQNPPDFWSTLHRISVMLDISYNKIAEMMEMSPARYAALRRTRKDPPVSSAMALGKRLNIGFDALVMNNFDYKVMARQYAGNLIDMPERYVENALSRKRTVITFLDFIEENFGIAQRGLILRKFQMTEAMLADPQELINVRFAVDLTNYLMDYYQNPYLLKHMGQYSAQRNTSHEAIQEFRDVLSAEEIFERAFQGFVPKYLERNFSWRILQMDEKSCIVEGVPTEEFLATPNAGELLTTNVCAIRTGILSYMPNYAKLGSARVEHTECVAQGAHSCKFHIHYDQLRTA